MKVDCLAGQVRYRRDSSAGPPDASPSHPHTPQRGGHAEYAFFSASMSSLSPQMSLYDFSGRQTLNHHRWAHPDQRDAGCSASRKRSNETPKSATMILLDLEIAEAGVLNSAHDVGGGVAFAPPWPSTIGCTVRHQPATEQSGHRPFGFSCLLYLILPKLSNYLRARRNSLGYCPIRSFSIAAPSKSILDAGRANLWIAYSNYN